MVQLLPPARVAYYTRVAREISRSATGYALGNLLTSLIAGVVVFVTLLLLEVPFPLLRALWVTLVDFLPMVGGALAGIPTVLFASGHSITAGIVTAVAFLAYQQIENHILNPVVMSRTANVKALAHSPAAHRLRLVRRRPESPGRPGLTADPEPVPAIRKEHTQLKQEERGQPMPPDDVPPDDGPPGDAPRAGTAFGRRAAG
ncbi:MAG: AI-2E family transporter [Actinobacteria bacterium]|nr:AI-2E family transporter [Actinomycetota bacterium]